MNEWKYCCSELKKWQIMFNNYMKKVRIFFNYTTAIDESTDITNTKKS